MAAQNANLALRDRQARRRGLRRGSAIAAVLWRTRHAAGQINEDRPGLKNLPNMGRRDARLGRLSGADDLDRLPEPAFDVASATHY